MAKRNTTNTEHHARQIEVAVHTRPLRCRHSLWATAMLASPVCAAFEMISAARGIDPDVGYDKAETEHQQGTSTSGLRFGVIDSKDDS